MLLAREFGWTPDEMRALRPSELRAILAELKRQKVAETYSEQRNKWAFLAAVITNGFSAVMAGLARRKAKVVEPDDFIGKELKKAAREVFGEARSGKTDWVSLIEDARAKALHGPWDRHGGDVA